jgi:predicted transcriptional regulator
MPAKKEQAVLDVVFPKARAEILRVLFGIPKVPRYVRELTRMTELALSTVQDELRKLEGIGLVNSWSNGYRRFYRSNQDHPLFAELARIVQQSANLPRVKSSALHQPGRRSRSRRKASGTRQRSFRSSNFPPIRWHPF